MSRTSVGLLAAVAALALAPVDAHAIPAFARKYGLSCMQCHAPIPRLTAFGEQFAANGFQLAPGEAPRDTIFTGDPLLRLVRGVPLAIRFDGFLQAATKSHADVASTDLQTPWGIKLLSGGPVADNISYYVYFYLTEAGNLTGVEDAYLQFTDIGGSGVNVIAGQFQVSDPLFKRELRLEYEDFQPYRLRVGDARANLTYDRGLMAFASPWEGGDVFVQLVNGIGLNNGEERKQFDTNGGKTVALRLSQEAGPLRVGAFGYWGREHVEGGTARNEVTYWGPDLTLALGQRAELNAQFLRRNDDNPFFLDDAPAGTTTVDAALAELVLQPQGAAGRVFLTGLFNWVESRDGRLISVGGFREDAAPDELLRAYRSAAVGAHWVHRRNVRLMGEASYDFVNDRARFTAGVVTAF
jgi:hypothetical protein